MIAIAIPIPVYAALLLNKSHLFFDTHFFRFLDTLLPGIQSTSSPVRYQTTAIMNVMYGVFLSSFSIFQFFSTLLLGAYSDSKGRKKAILFSLLIMVFGFMFLSLGTYIQSLALLFLGYALLGIGGGNITVYYSILADISTIKTKAKYFGLVGVCFGIAFIIGPLLGGILTKSTSHYWLNYTLPFIISTICCFIGLLISLAFLPETLENPTRSEKIFSRSFESLKTFLSKQSTLRTLLFTVFTITIGFTFFREFFSSYMFQKFEYLPNHTGRLFGYMGIWMMITQGIFLRILPKFSNTTTIILIFLPLLAISFLVLLLPDTGTQMYLALPFVVIAQSMVVPNINALISNSASMSEQGTVLGVNQSLQAFAQIAPPFITGFGVVMHLSMPFILAFLVTMIGFLLYIAYYLKEKNSGKN